MPKQNVFNFVHDYKMTLPFFRCHTSLYFRYMQYFYVLCVVL